MDAVLEARRAGAGGTQAALGDEHCLVDPGVSRVARLQQPMSVSTAPGTAETLFS